jgi:hypothetical protein
LEIEKGKEDIVGHLAAMIYSIRLAGSRLLKSNFLGILELAPKYALNFVFTVSH